MKEIKYCKTCGFRDPQQPKCQLLGHQIDPDIDYCSRHNAEPFTCAQCHRILTLPIFLTPGGAICDECRLALSTCAGCRNSSTCLFESDPSPVPKVIQQQIRQGNMVIQQPVKNPLRIQITCEKGCLCYDKENGCRRQLNSCENHKSIIQEEETND